MGSVRLKKNTMICIFFRSVSWVRVSDGHILIVDKEVFSSDARISSVLKPMQKLWILQVVKINTKANFGLHLSSAITYILASIYFFSLSLKDIF